MMICPQCGYERKKSDDIISLAECPKCGIIYNKYRTSSSGAATQSAPEISGEPEPVTETKRKSPIERLVIYAGIVVVLVVLMHSLVATPLIKFIKTAKTESPVDANSASSEGDHLESDNLRKAGKQEMSPASGREASVADTQDLQISYSRSSSTGHSAGREVYCFADGNGQVSFVAWRTGMQVSRPDGTLDRMKFERWALEQIGGNPDAIGPEREARDDLEKNREQLFKSVFPSRSMSDNNLTPGEKDWLERRYQRHYVEIYNQRMAARNEAIRKYNSMMNEFDRFSAGRK